MSTQLPVLLYDFPDVTKRQEAIVEIRDV